MCPTVVRHRRGEGTTLGPMTLAAWRGEPIRGVAFVVGFYALFVGARSCWRCSSAGVVGG